MPGDYKRWKSGTERLAIPAIGREGVLYLKALARAERVIGKQAIADFLAKAEREGMTVDADTLNTLVEIYEGSK